MKTSNLNAKFILCLFMFFFSYKICISQLSNGFMGTDFWLGYGRNELFGNIGESLVLYISTGNQTTNVQVEIDSSGFPGLSWKQTYNNVAANSVVSVTIPNTGTYNATLGTYGLHRRKGIHVTSSVPVSVYAYNSAPTSAGGTSLLPTDKWGIEYVCANSNQDGFTSASSWVYIIAKENNTTVQILPSVSTNGQGFNTNTPTSIELQKGQIYQIFATGFTSAGDQEDLTGTLIKSISNTSGAAKPIAVFSGSSRTSNPLFCGFAGRDNDIAQLKPLNTWGTRYLTAPFSFSNSFFIAAFSSYKICVSDPTTIVTRNGIQLTGLIKNKYYITHSFTPDYIVANKPIQVLQTVSGGLCSGTMQSLGDPDIVLLTPLEQAADTAFFYRTTNGDISRQYLTVIVPTNGLSSLRLDGSQVFDTTYAHPNLANYTVVMKKWNVAANAYTSVTCDSAYLALTYGVGSSVSYMANLTNKLASINNSTLTLLPSKLVGLQVVKYNKYTRVVSWKAYNEVNVLNYEVEFSTDAASFNTVLSVPAKNVSNAAYSNIYTVQALSGKKEYYRIKTIDIDGKFSFSNIFTLDNNAANKVDLTIKTNPFKDRIVLQINNSTQSVEAYFVVSDMSGRVITSTTKRLNLGNNLITIDNLERLQIGTYLISIQINGVSQGLKVIK